MEERNDNQEVQNNEEPKKEESKTSMAKSHGRSVRAIDPILNETLFKLWLSGKSLMEIHRLYEGTPKEFSLRCLYRTVVYYKWRERKELLLAAIREKTNEDIEIFLARKIDIVNETITLSHEEMIREYKLYVSKNYDQRYRPGWLIGSAKDMEILFKLHDFLVSGGTNKHSVDVNSNINVGMEMSDEVAAKMLKLLSDEATKKAIQGSGGVVEAEIIEEEESEDDLIEEEKLLMDHEQSALMKLQELVKDEQK